MAVAVYLPALSNGFVWDDPVILERQLDVFDSLRAILITPRDIPQYSPDYYRPTTTVFYLLDRWLGGGDPFAFHFSVVVAHAVASLLVAALAAWLAAPGSAALGAFAAGALFAVHPIHSESVAWAAGRSDVLATVFALAVFVISTRRRMGGAWVVASGICAFLALGAKEVALAMVPLLVVLAYLRRQSSGEITWRHAGIAASLIVYLVLRTLSIGEVVGAQAGEASPLSAAPSLLWALGAYVGKLLWPLPLNAYIDSIPRDWKAVAGLVALLAASAAALRRWRAGDWVWLFALAWFAAGIAPSLAILWKIPEVPMAERYLYFPSVGLCLAVGVAAARAGRPAIVGAVLAIVLTAASIAVWFRSPVWHDDISLWEDTAAHAVVSGMALRSLGAAYIRAGRDDEAKPVLERALQMRNPATGLQGIYSNLGTIELKRQRFAAARELYEKALEVNPNGADLLYNLGLSIFYAGGQSADAAGAALPHFRRSAEINPYDADVDAVLGQVYAILGEPSQARHHLRRALEKGVQPATRAGVEKLLSEISD